jgi:phage-related protein
MEAHGMKPLRFFGSSLSDLTGFPAAARRTAGHELWQVQCGLMPGDFKPMPSVGAGCHEIRIHSAGEWRVVYVATFDEAVYVLHAFGKKAQAIARHDLELARKRYRQIRK